MVCTLKDLTGQKNHSGVSYLEENRSIQIHDETTMAKVFNEHFMGLAERLADKTVGQFDPTVLKAFVDEHKVSDSKLAFPPITPSPPANKGYPVRQSICPGQCECLLIEDCSTCSSTITCQTYQHLYY